MLQVGYPHVLQPCIAGAHRALGLTVIHPTTYSSMGSICSPWFDIKIISVFHLSLEFLIAEKSLQPALAGTVQQCWVLCVLLMWVYQWGWKAWALGGVTPGGTSGGAAQQAALCPSLQPHPPCSTALVLEGCRQALAHVSTLPVSWQCCTGKAVWKKPPAVLPWVFGSCSTFFPHCPKTHGPNLQA